MESYGVLWGPLECYGVLWSPMGSFGMLWMMESYGVLWDPMESYGVRDWVLIGPGPMEGDPDHTNPLSPLYQGWESLTSSLSSCPICNRHWREISKAETLNFPFKVPALMKLCRPLKSFHLYFGPRQPHNKYFPTLTSPPPPPPHQPHIMWSKSSSFNICSPSSFISSFCSYNSFSSQSAF